MNCSKGLPLQQEIKENLKPLKLLSLKGKSLTSCSPEGGTTEDGFGETKIVISLQLSMVLSLSLLLYYYNTKIYVKR